MVTHDAAQIVDFRSASTPYRAPIELLNDQLRFVRARLDELCEREMHSACGLDVDAIESLIARRLGVSDPANVPIARLYASFRLTESERRVLWVLVAHELCPEARARVRELNTEQLSDATTDTLRRIVYREPGSHSAWIELAEAGTLRRLGLIERTDAGTAVPIHRQTWKIADRVLALVHGEVGLDAKLAKLAEMFDPGSEHELVIAGNARERLSSACDGNGIVVAYGGAGTGRRSLLGAVIHAREQRILQIDGHSIAKDRDLAHSQLRGLARECALLGLVPLIRDLDALVASGDVAERLDLVETELPGLVVATAARAISRRWRRAVTQVELEPLSGDERARAWLSALPALSPTSADNLATLYPLAPGLIQATSVVVREHSCGHVPTSEQIAEGLRSILDDRVAGLATRVTVTQTWDDMVLPEDQLAAIVELMARIRERRTVYERWGFAKKLGKGLGVAALFSGPPGTGKTMAAGLIARDLGVEIHQVDLSKIVSKWLEVDRRDREEPRGVVRRSGSGARDPLVRRGGRVVRQTYGCEVE
ncbi:MAG: AAA family ATPase [Kofleriaceae bacterium]